MTDKNGVLMKCKGLPVVDISDDDFGCILNCAIRYSLGRRTYIPHTVIQYIKPILPYLTKNTLVCMERDICEAENYGAGYGDEKIDKPEWLEFLQEVQNEISRRGIDAI